MDRALRAAQGVFLAADSLRARVDAIRAARVESGPPTDESSAGVFIRLSDLLCEIGGDDAARELVVLLGYDDPGVRVAAAENLVEMGFERYVEVARAMEEGVERGTDTTALSEIPFVLAELGEPGGVKICVRLLKHRDGDVVGAAVEALAELGDPSVTSALVPLRADTRTLAADDDDPNQAGPVTVGDLVEEALEILAEHGAR